MTKRENKVYHIYAKDKCIYHSLTEEEFKVNWEALNNLVGIYTEYQQQDLSFEELVINKQVCLESSH
jgi:hypothetical protein